MWGLTRRELLAGFFVSLPVMNISAGLEQRLIKSEAQVAVQEEKDYEFLALYGDIKWLENILEQNLPKIPKTRERFIDEYDNEVMGGGNGRLSTSGQPPESIGDLLEKTFYERVASLASRYGVEISATGKIFTSGKSIIVSDVNNDQCYLIFDENSLIRQTNRFYTDGAENPGIRRWPYLNILSHQTQEGKFKIEKLPEVRFSGLIPYFKHGNFGEIADKITEYLTELNRSIEAGYDRFHGKPSFFEKQLENIGAMLIEMLENSADENIKGYLHNMFLIQVGMGAGRILVEGWSNYEIIKGLSKGMDPGMAGDVQRVSLSIGPQGDVKYWSKDVDADKRFEYSMNARVTHADLRMKFPYNLSKNKK